MTLLELSLLGVGIGLLIAAVLWRAASRRRARRLLKRALRADDPALRKAAIRLMSDRGLAPHAKLLLRVVDREADESVLATLGEVVRRNHWEPDDRRSVVELRLWARRQAEAAPGLQPSRRPAPASSNGKPPIAWPPPSTRPQPSTAPSGFDEPATPDPPGGASVTGNDERQRERRRSRHRRDTRRSRRGG